jgi:hypothetical protein
VWPLRHSLDTAPGWVADPIQLAVLQRHQGEWKASNLTDTDLDEHRQAIEAAEKHLRTFADTMRIRPGAVTPVPEPPKPAR